MRCFLPRSEGRQQNPLMPSIYLDGMAACFSSLARRFAVSDAVNGGENNGDEDSGADPEFASLEDAQYVQAVIEAVRASSRDKTWRKVIRRAIIPAAPKNEENQEDPLLTAEGPPKDAVDGRHWRRRGQRRQ